MQCKSIRKRRADLSLLILQKWRTMHPVQRLVSEPLLITGKLTTSHWTSDLLIFQRRPIVEILRTVHFEKTGHFLLLCAESRLRLIVLKFIFFKSSTVTVSRSCWMLFKYYRVFACIVNSRWEKIVWLRWHIAKHTLMWHVSRWQTQLRLRRSSSWWQGRMLRCCISKISLM